MTLRERLNKLLTEAGISEKDQQNWDKLTEVMPFDKAEVLLYILEQLEKSDIIYFNGNLKEKITVIGAKDNVALDEIFGKEKKFLSGAN
jgi:hypothetical protein